MFLYHLVTPLSFPEKKSVLIPCLALFLAVFFPLGAEASVQSFSGSISLQQDYDSNWDRRPRDEAESETSSRVQPGLTYTRSTRTSDFTLTYAPSYVYNYRAREDRVDQFASAGYGVDLSRRTRLDLDNTYRLTDDPYLYTEFVELDEGEFELSDKRGRRRYWSNSFSGSIRREYARDSHVSLGYRNHLLRNRNDDFDDFTRHTPFAALVHHFSHRWQGELSYQYTIADFDGREDRATHNADGRLFHALSPMTRVYVYGGYTRTDYDEVRRDYNVYTAAVGFDRELSRVRRVSAETGYSFIRRDNSDDEAFYLKASLDNTIQRGSWRVHGESGVDQRYYTVADDDWLSRYWLAGVRFSYQLARSLTGNAGAVYREDENIDDNFEGSDRERLFRGNVNLAYAFGRWYQLAVGYRYTDLDADRRTSYDNHHAYVTLSAGRELLRW